MVTWKIFYLRCLTDCFSGQKKHQNLGWRIVKFQYYNFWKIQGFVKWENCSKHLLPVQRIIHLCIINFHLFFLHSFYSLFNYLVRQNSNFMFVLIPYRPKVKILKLQLHDKTRRSPEKYSIRVAWLTVFLDKKNTKIWVGES